MPQGVPIENEHTSSADLRRALIATAAFTSGLIFLRFGYDVGISDQEEFLSLLINRIHPGLLAGDWYVSVHDGGIGVRTGIVTLLAMLTRVLSIPTAVLLVYIGSVLLSITAVFRLSWLLSRSVSVSAVSTLVALVLTHHWNLGGNEILGGMLVPGMIAWGLALWSLERIISERFVIAGAILGAAALFQPLVGLLIAAALSLVVIAESVPLGLRRMGIRLFGFFGSFLAVSAVVLVPLVLDQIRAPGSERALYILTEFRAPHHYLPGAFPVASYIKFAFIALLGGAGYHFLQGTEAESARSVTATFLTVVSAFLVVSFLGTAVVPVALVTKLQLFKLTVPAKVLLIILAAAGCSRRWVSGRTGRAISSTDAVLSSPRMLAASGIFLLALSIAAVSWPALSHRTLRAQVRESGPEGEMIRWVREHTPTGSIFAIPPSLSGFRYRAERPVYIDFKAMPFRGDSIVEWYRRLQRIAPLPAATEGGVPAMFALDESFERADQATLVDLARTEGFSYVLRRSAVTGILPEPGMELVFSNDAWWLYRVYVVSRARP